MLNSNGQTNKKRVIQASLDLTRRPAGNYYFNQENNYNYTKNWFNYNQFHILTNQNVIEQVIQTADPDLVPGTLDNSKTYTLPSTSMYSDWGARVETGNNYDTPGFSGTDINGNTYLSCNYDFPNNAKAYDANNILFSSKAPNGVNSRCGCLTKFDSNGNVQWSSRIRSMGSGNTVNIDYCVSDNEGFTYLLVNTNDNFGIVLEDATGTNIFTVPCKWWNTCLIAYNSSGTPDWVTFFTRTYKTCLHVDNQSIGNVFVGFIGDELLPTIFYDGVPTNPTPVLAVGKTVAFGINQITAVERNAGISYLTLYTLASDLGLEINMYFALLGTENDGGSFNGLGQINNITNYGTYSVIEYTNFSNSSGTDPFPEESCTGAPILTIAKGGVFAKFRSSSGLFLWTARISGDLTTPRDFLDYSNQFLTTDSEGNLFISGRYKEISAIENAATTEEPFLTPSDITLPPYSTPVIWVPYESDRNWSAVDINESGNIMVATVNGGYIYVSTDNGYTWNQRATLQAWSSVYCNASGNLMIATVLNAVIYRSTDYGETWQITGGEGTNAREWVAIAGNASGSQLVAVAKIDQIYYSNDYGATWNASNSSIKNWIDVAYDATSNSFIALVHGELAYSSNTAGMTWVSISSSPSLNWSAITGSRAEKDPQFNFLATVENGELYWIQVGTPYNFSIRDTTVRNYSDIAMTGGFAGMMYATVFDGSVYQTIIYQTNTWTPTTIPRFWNRIALSYAFNGYGPDATVVATVKGGQIYVARESFPLFHTFIIKYDPNGKALWANYINTEDPEGPNAGISITCNNQNGNIIIFGSGSRAKFYSTTDFENPIKIIDSTTPPEIARYVACYSNDGLPLWVNTSVLVYSFPFPNYSPYAQYKSLSVDDEGNIYCFGYAKTVELYNPDGTLAISQNDSFSAILTKYYSNGFVQSFTRIQSINQYAFGSSIRVLGSGDIYLSGWHSTNGLLELIDSDFQYATYISFNTPGAYVGKYYFDLSPSYIFPPVSYNSTFQTKLSVGGSIRKITGGYIGDDSIELWGGKDFTIEPINIIDANATVVARTGHQPGYNTNSNFTEQRYLTVGLTEPSFPLNDPQPVSPGTIPYGFLPIYISFPSYTTGLMFNNTLNDQSPLMLFAMGTIPANGLFVTGVSIGDMIRFLIYTTESAQYVSLTVKGFVLSNIAENIQAGLVFNESTLYINYLLNTTTTATSEVIFLGSERYLPAFYQPPLILSGRLHLALDTYPIQNLSNL